MLTTIRDGSGCLGSGVFKIAQVLDRRAPSDPMEVVDIAPDTIPPLLPGVRGTGGARRQSPTFSVVLPGA